MEVTAESQRKKSNFLLRPLVYDYEFIMRATFFARKFYIRIIEWHQCHQHVARLKSTFPRRIFERITRAWQTALTRAIVIYPLSSYACQEIAEDFFRFHITYILNQLTVDEDMAFHMGLIDS